ncbi:hypothetical protein H7J86_27175 [Mycobacterium hackensackense]|uniref:hypothetical protein n=1 Tax=Mycobacterium hackensackense TaxID=228909 RepID=UPI0022658CC4|nr:hypothetical protein [Mycobacterium hackensackense]MCV7255855.1 hypothetical protein [Mycobacterium hackensackense]
MFQRIERRFPSVERRDLRARASHNPLVQSVEDVHDIIDRGFLIISIHRGICRGFDLGYQALRFVDILCDCVLGLLDHAANMAIPSGCGD